MRKFFLGMAILLSSLLSYGSYDDILDIAERFQKQKKAVERLENQKRGLMSKVYSLERETRKISKMKNRLKNKKILLNRNLRQSTNVIVNLEDKIKGITKGLQRRLDASRSMQKMPWMYILLSSYDPIGLERTSRVIKKINLSEAEIVKEYLSNINKLKVEKENLYKVAKKLILVSKDIKEQELQFKMQHILKKGILKKIEKQITAEKRNIRRDRHLGIKMSSQSELENLKLLFATSFFDKKRKIPAPVVGPVLHAYGLNKKLLRKNIQVMHKGNFYSVKPGTPVLAIAEGKIASTERLKGLGRVVIVDHGSHYFAVYAHLNTLGKKKNDVVKPGEILGVTGHRNRQFGPGLYFEIRHYSEAENPREWLKATKPTKNLAQDVHIEKGEI